MRRLEELATPPAREIPSIRDPFKVPITALTYKISKRLLKIAFPKAPVEIMPPRIPGKVSPAALKAVGTYFSNFFLLSFPPPLPLLSSLPTCHSTRTNFRRISRRACLLKTVGVGKWPSLENSLVRKFSTGFNLCLWVEEIGLIPFSSSLFGGSREMAKV